MVDFIAADINKFEEQMLYYIEAYYNILKDKDEPNLPNIKFNIKDWCEKIIQQLDLYFDNNENKKLNNLRKEVIVNYLKKTKEKKKPKIEFYMVLNIAHILYEIYYTYKRKKKNERSDRLKYNRTSSIYKEIIELRNELSHNQNGFILEDILRIYEDFYYLIKFMKPEVSSNVKIDEKFCKEIKENIHIYLEKNLNYDKSFELNELFEEFKQFEFENKKIDISPKKIINIDEKLLKNNTEKAIQSLFQFPPKKLPVYDFKKAENLEINKNENQIIQDNEINDEEEKEKEEEKNENEKSDIFSNDSISEGFSKSSSNSERNSINEMEGNIKKSDETTFIDSKYDIQKGI